MLNGFYFSFFSENKLKGDKDWKEEPKNEEAHKNKGPVGELSWKKIQRKI